MSCGRRRRVKILLGQFFYAQEYRLTLRGNHRLCSDAPGGTRTHNLLIRSQSLSPIELQAHDFDL